MPVQTAVDVLARLLDAYESSDRSIHHVGATSLTEGGDALDVDLEVAVPVAAAVEGQTPKSASLTADGTLAVEYSTGGLTSVPSPPEAEVTTEPTSARIDDGLALVSLEVTITPTDTTDRRERAGTDAGRDDTERPDTGEDTAASDNTPSRVRAAAPDAAAATGAGDGRGVVAAADRGDALIPGEDTPEDRLDAVDTTDGGIDTDDTPRHAADTDSETGSPEPAEFSEVRDETVPPYEDTAYLRAIYQRYETFSEMREAIEMDVSTETVRRYMIDVGVHDPNSYGNGATEAHSGDTGEVRASEEPTDGADDAERPASIPDEYLATDGIGLPDDLSLEEVQEAVVECSTVYQVTRALDLDQRRTREVLDQLDLLELVMHRVADDHEREVTHQDVADRLRRTVGSA